MTDQLSRLAAALADCYRIEYEIGSGGMADRILNDEQGISNDDVVLMQLRHSLFKIRHS